MVELFFPLDESELSAVRERALGASKGDVDVSFETCALKGDKCASKGEMEASKGSSVFSTETVMEFKNSMSLSELDKTRSSCLSRGG